ncbi:MAG: right-handed parallel beta-helix repeat-containing protein [Bacteroidetes bacterium]|nr:right-handed parallel beta-helix repeat-containing protein [Bacteroidota bacterium]
MKKTALTPWHGIAMFAGMVLLSLGACKKDVSVNPADTATKANLPKFDFKPKSLATLTSYTSSPVINYNRVNNITISGLSIAGGTVPSISLNNCSNVHITQCSLGNTTTVAIQLYNCTNITIDYCYFTKCATGVYAVSCPSGYIITKNNQFLNMQGPFPRGQAVQYNQCNGPGMVISNNMIQNIIGQCSTYEVISCYKTNGTPASPVQINANWILGAGPNWNSGGLQLGDNGGSYITATNNVLVNPGSDGLSVSGGDHIVVSNNTVYSSGSSWSNVGISVWGQVGYAVTNCTVSGNKIKFISKAGAENDSFIGSGTPTPTGWSTNTFNAAISASILPSSIITANAATVPLQPASSTTSSTTTTTPTSSPINYTGQNNVAISNLTITGGTVPCITLTNCNGVFISDCTLQNSSDVAILLTNCTNVTIQTNLISNVAAGILAVNCPNGGIKIMSNKMKNMQGQKYYGAFVEFSNVGGANNVINWNKMQNFAGQSNTRNAIDIVASNGTSASPITISTNQIEGGGPSTTGGGIMLGHSGGSYQVATGNSLVNPGQMGMSVAGGSNISITSNKIFASQQSFTNAGIIVWGQGSTITNSTVSGNQVNWTNSSGVQNSDYLGSGETTPSGWSTNTWGASTITASILPATLF